MSQIKLLHSGGNGVSIVAPDSNPASDRTLKLPSDGDGTILTTNSSVGKTLKVFQALKTDTASTNSQTESDLITLNVQPTAAGSSVLIFVDLKIGASSKSPDPQFMLYRSSTKVYHGDTAGNRLTGFFGGDEYDSYNNATWLQKQVSANYLDTPSYALGDTITYKVKWRIVNTGDTLYLNRTGADNDSAAYHRSASSLIAMEVAA